MTDLKCFNKIGFAREYEQNKETLKEKEKGSTYPV